MCQDILCFFIKIFEDFFVCYSFSTQNRQSSKIVHARMITAKLRKAIAIDANRIVTSLHVILLYANKPTAMHRNALTNFLIMFMIRFLSNSTNSFFC